jgi:hypothetical protein
MADRGKHDIGANPEKRKRNRENVRGHGGGLWPVRREGSPGLCISYTRRGENCESVSGRKQALRL